MASFNRNGNDRHARARKQMVARQIEARGVTNSRVLRVMSELPREIFVPATSQAGAYEDRALPIGSDQTISQPYMVALMTEKLEPDRGHTVLEIGTGSGYQTAILAKLVKTVYTVERLPELSRLAGRTLAELGITNVRFKIDDGTVGWSEFAPYDRIMVTAGAPDVPRTLTDQLAEDGIMIIPVGPQESQTLLAVRKSAGRCSQQSIIACRFVKLLGREGWPEQ